MKYFKTLATLSVIASLTGCSVEEQDVVDDIQEENSIVVSGAVVDPFITSAIVFADYNNDGILDAFEPWAFTDSNGYYGTSEDGEDYCTNNTKYCLKLPSDETVKLVAVGGYDLTTLEKVTSRLSRIYSGSGTQFITPLTSVTGISLNELETIDKDVNFMIDALSSQDDAFSLAFKLHQIVQIISNVITEEFPVIGDDESLPIDIAGYIYDAISKVGQEEELTLTALLDQLTDDQVSSILDDVRGKLSTLTGTSRVFSSNGLNSVASSLRSFIELYNTTIQTSVNYASSNDGDTTEAVSAATRMITGFKEVYSEAIDNGTTPDNNAYNSIFNTLMFTPELLTSIAAKYFDLSLLDLDSAIALERSLQMMSERPTLPESLVETEFVLTDTSGTRRSTIGFFFNYNNSLTACIKFQNLNDPDDSNNTTGILLSGNWIKNNYAINLGLTIAGTEQALRIKTKDDTTFIFDYDNDETEWDTEAGFTSLTNGLPSTDLECQSWLADLTS